MSRSAVARSVRRYGGTVSTKIRFFSEITNNYFTSFVISTAITILFLCVINLLFLE
jgi:hypothetical protein